MVDDASGVPDEAGELASDRGDDEVGVLAAGTQAPELVSEPQLSFPGEVADLGFNGLGAAFDDGADLGGVSIRPRGLDQKCSCPVVAGAGDWALSPGVA